MEALQIITMALAMACTIGPAIGLATLALYRIITAVAGRGFTVTARVPGRGKQ